MLSKVITVADPHGVHLRVAAKIVKASRGHDAKIVLYKDGKKANAESILELMLLEAPSQSQVTVEISGKDAEQALNQIELVLVDGAGI